MSVKRIQPFETLAQSARFVLEVEIADAGAFTALARLLADHRGARGEARATVPVPGGTATVLLGRDFLLDEELREHVEHLPGVTAARLAMSEVRLQLVG